MRRKTPRKYKIYLFGSSHGSKTPTVVPAITVAESATLEEATKIIKSLETQREAWEKNNLQGEVLDAVRYLEKGSDIEAFADDPNEQVSYTKNGWGERHLFN